jgi:hypothetical protein
MESRLWITITDVKGKETHAFGKSQKGLKRDHKKGKCDRFCNHCYNEAMKTIGITDID